MARPRNPAPSVSGHNGRMRARFTTDAGPQEVDLGPVSDPVRWKSNLARLHARLAVDPNASLRKKDERLVPELFRDFLKAESCSLDVKAEVKRAGKLLAVLHAATAAVEFGPLAFAEWRIWLCRRTEAGRQVYSARYVRAMMSHVLRVWKWAVATERLPVERYQALTTVPGPKYGEARASKEVPAADEAAVLATLPFLRPPPRAMVELQRLTGARPSELFRMRPRNVHTAGVVTLPGAGPIDLSKERVWVYVPERHKTERHRKPRWVILGRRAQAILRPFLAHRDPDVACFQPREALADLRREQRDERSARGGGSGGDRKPKSAGTSRRPGEKYNRQSYRQAVRRAAEKAGVEPWNPYQLRHLFAERIDLACGLDATQHAMGHSSPQTTRRYAKRSFATAAGVAKELG